MTTAEADEPPTSSIGDIFQPEPGQAKTSAADRVRAVGNWARDTGLGITGFVVVLIVALAGWTASFIGLHNFGMTHMALDQDTAWLVPITFDGAAGGLSLVVFRASINARGASLWRLLIVVFTALSSWINWEHITDPTGRWIAAFMPPAAVILFEGLMSEARAAAARRDGSERPRVHLLRWFVDRSGTWAIYRAYILGIELPDALKEAAAGIAVSAQDERADGRPPERAPDAHVERDGDAHIERPLSAEPERGERAQDEHPRRPIRERRERAQRKPMKSAAKSIAERRRERVRALYADLGRRPEWSEIRDALVGDRLADKTISRSSCQRIRDAIESDHPELAALGSPNVRSITGS
jgi:hypothetical protein